MRRAELQECLSVSLLLSACAHAQAFGVLGSSGAGPLEVEGEPGISLTLASLPGVELSVMHTLRSSIPSEGEHVLP
jgi:small ligand-binding sensory domain FIST